MDSDFATPSTSFVKCCDCGCSCSPAMNRSFSGSILRSVKRKLDNVDEEENSFMIPGFVIPQNPRIEIENECNALREMVANQQLSIQDLLIELEEERNASSSATNEAMSMILRLQREKAEIQMELRQFRRFAEEKMAHDQQEVSALEDLMYKRDQAIESLTFEVHMYKHRMMSYGLTEAEAEGDKAESGSTTRNGSMLDNYDGQPEFIPTYDYPPLKCNLNAVHVEIDNEAADVEKYAFGETPRSLRDLEYRIDQLERSPKNSHPDGDSFGAKNTLEKVIVGYSPRRNRHFRKFSTDSASPIAVNGREMPPDFAFGSPKFGGSATKADFSHPEEVPNMKKGDNNVSDVGDEMSDRVYTIDSVHTGSTNHNGDREPKASVAVFDDYVPTEKGSHTNVGEPEIQKLYMRLQALEADRESMRQALISMRTDKAQLILLKEIAQNLSKEMSPMRNPPASKPSLIRSLSLFSLVKWIVSFVFWRKKARRCRYMFGLSANDTGLLMLLDKGPSVRQWRCLSSTQV